VQLVVRASIRGFAASAVSVCNGAAAVLGKILRSTCPSNELNRLAPCVRVHLSLSLWLQSIRRPLAHRFLIFLIRCQDDSHRRPLRSARSGRDFEGAFLRAVTWWFARDFLMESNPCA